MFTAQNLIAEIEAFIDRNSMSASAFGRAAVGDPNLVGDLRKGRSPSLRTLDRVRAYMIGIGAMPLTTPDTSPEEAA